ncbi:SCO family protein [Psychromonas sp. RZ22]|nr:SCO family protein [Psychromonas sp. RZ22]
MDTSKNSALILSQPPIELSNFTFYKAGKVAFTNQSLQGKWTLFFVGYTFCPDICPTTLTDLDRIYPSLKNDQNTTTQVVFVSVDPNRDKAEQLADYVHYFNENFIGVTGTHKQLWPFVNQLGLIYSLVEEGESDAFYLVDHSASIVLINPAGQFHATFKSVLNEQGINHVDMDLMVRDIKKIQQQYEQDHHQ